MAGSRREGRCGILGAGAVIFASVGSMLPFDRFVEGIDVWAGQNPDVPVFIQIGEGEYEPKNAPWARIVPHDEYQARLEECSLFVAHVGMGSIMQALEKRKQMLLVPRYAERGEHTTDHQLATAEKFRDTKGLLIVNEVEELHREMTRLLANPLQSSDGIPQFAESGFTQKVGAFLRGD